MSTKIALLTVAFIERCPDAESNDAEREAVEAEAWLTAASVSVRSAGGRVTGARENVIKCVFTTAHAAVKATVELLAGNATDLPLRAGLHQGAVIAQAGDVSGETVDVATFLLERAEHHQLLITRTVLELLPRDYRGVVRTSEEAAGAQGSPLEVFSLDWEALSREESTGDALVGGNARLRLFYRHEMLEVGPHDNDVVIGRGRRAQMVVNDVMASRKHLLIQSRGGRFYAVDLSTNGTYLATDDKVSYLSGGELELRGQGRISLGRNPSEAMHFVDYVVLK